MEGPIGIKQIAKLAEVSIGTVDRVLHDREGVSKTTRQRVLAVIKEAGYKKNTVASRLKLASHKKIKIAVLIPEVTNNWRYWELPKKGINKAVDELSELGILVTYYYFSDPLSFMAGCDKVLEADFDGMVTVPFFKAESNDLMKRAKQKSIPVVFLDTEIALDHPGYFICQNSHHAGKVAGRLLHGLAGDEGLYVVVNLINAKGPHANNKQRESGFREFFRENCTGKDIEIQTVNHPLDRSFEITPDMESWLKNKRPKGIFVTNSRAYVIPEILRKYGIDNASIVGFDLNRENRKCLKDEEIAFLINQKPEYQGYTAIKGLFRFLTEKDASELYVDISVEIIVKENLYTEVFST
ncbi:LacI family DNA-binding transcriptional regulator [Sinomicrobium weinanense]|uniref:LacI family DNA-binding transcriptional regulator n=1 Tax=Sinomicrobium weinanense TaxID=2842200 RepID=A0A926JPK6_9FLAO|nr:LacI family DNA-binding transcriptional regulator [Sinomicrobium weinanense]MBC9794984.1 LacI family DNA-binding transcriptional regulator [Sinomicrobium weinanense]MBU3125155.1 LacI family transcriptional regulator [Sinomicrobium weinanense]